MDDNFINNDGFNQSNFDPNRPRLKKVKRPIKRLVSSPNGIPVPPKSNPNINNTDFNLDEFLDENKSQVPTLPNARTSFVDEQDIAGENVSFRDTLINGNLYTAKAVVLIAIFAFIVGFGFTKLFFGEETIVRDGLQGVVINPEVPRGRPRCGVAERTQGCVLYIMNPQRQDLNARDFYDLASQLTGRQRFVIETGNMRYSNIKIRPGNIAQLNIPPLQ